MKKLIYLLGCILYEIFKINLNNFKKPRDKADNSSIRRYVNRTENKITYKIKTGYYLELLTPETIKLFGSKLLDHAKPSATDALKLASKRSI